MILFEILVGNDFPGEPPTNGVFTAQRSGEFNDSSIWTNGIVPYGAATVNIAPNATVTVTRDYFDLNMITCNVNGTLIFGDSTKSSVELAYPTNLTIYQQGSVQFVSSVRTFTMPVGTLIIAYPNSTLSGNNVTVITGSSARSLTESSARGFFDNNGRGPRTDCGLERGNSFSRDAVCDLPRRSGEWDDDNNWFGGRAPSRDRCRFVGGCSLNMEIDVTLSTSFLGGRLDVNYFAITVSVRSTFQLGAPGFSAGFRFTVSMTMNIFGVLADVKGTTGGLWVTISTQVNFVTGARFSCAVDTFLVVYDPITNAIINRALLSRSLTGPRFFTIDVVGTISISTRGNNFDFFILQAPSLCFRFSPR